jgi:hypothetical protein
MQAETRNMRESVTYWPPGDNDGMGGVAYAAPRTVLCRWQDTMELFRDAQGNEVTSSAVVYPAERLELKGYVLNGVSNVADPHGVAGAREIRAVASSPNLSQTRELHKIWL